MSTSTSTSTSSFYSQAGNFISSIQGGVDPRTGLFNINFPLFNLHANMLSSFALSLSLRYSPLSMTNEGFGNGLILGLTSYNTKTGKLSLSTGEEYRISSNGKIVKQKKIKNFIFKNTGDNKCQVIYKSGIIEYLSLRKEVYVTTRIKMQDGRGLKLSWSSEYNSARLIQVMDDMGIILCSISYPTNKISTTKLTILPDDINLNYSIIFKFINEFLVKVTSQAINPSLVWSFDYDDIGVQKSYRAITGISYPTGMVEKVRYYTDKGMAFPSIANLTDLPCVFQHSIRPGYGQTVVLTEWEWTKKNYLGKNAGLNQWHPDVDQMLNILLKDYEYGSTAKLIDTDKSTVLNKVTRRYNSYHLLISEVTLRAGKTYTQSAQYYAKAGATFEEQPAQYAFVKSKKEQWSDSRTAMSRSQETHSQYDNEGNLLYQKLPNGEITEYSYYDSDGEENNCPADPFGFKRYPKKKTVTPLQITNNEPISETLFTWKRLNTLNNENYFVVKKTMLEMIGKVKTETQYQYYEEPIDKLNFARMRSEVVSLIPNVENEQSFITTNNFIYDTVNSGLKKITHYIGYDGLNGFSETVNHFNTGNLLSETDIQGVTTLYSYDRMGRLLTQILAANTDYTRTLLWDYAIEKEGPVITETDVLGNCQKTYFDGAGRKIRIHRLDRDNSNQWYEVFSCVYNVLGEVNDEQNHDFLILADQQETYSLQILAQYDGWGNANVLFSPAIGITSYQLVDPIRMEQTTYNYGQLNGSVLKSGKLKITLNKISQLPESEQRYDTFDNNMGSRRFEWDGLGRLNREIDELGHVTDRSYDEYNRVLSHTLPDGSMVNYSYAPHLSGEQIATISVTEFDANGKKNCWLLGSQEFDSLGRLIKQCSGGRITRYQYQDLSPTPATVILPSGEVINYTYIPELDNAVSSTIAKNIKQTFDYDPSSGNLLHAKEGFSENNNVWNMSGSLQEEQFIQKGKKRNAGYLWTLAGELVRYADITGALTHFKRDKHGRLVEIKDHVLTAKLEYDVLGRLSHQRIIDNKSSTELITSFEYNDFNQEIKRTVTDDEKIILTLSQSWLNNGLLATKTTQQGQADLKDEKYSYDVRNRLIKYEVIGNNPPSDPYGNLLTEQVYNYDALNNLTHVITKLVDGSTDVATYHYANQDDPTQLTSVRHTHSHYPQSIDLEYDVNGRMTLDESGRILSYDVIGRLIDVGYDKTQSEPYKDNAYSYNALNQLIRQNVIGKESRELYYRGNELINEVLVDENRQIRLIKWKHTCLGISEDSHLTLMATDQKDSLLWSRNSEQRQGNIHTWSPYGNGSSTELLLGFNGERIDPVSGTYHLGNGYRAYNPTLMRFNCPDNLSPFGVGGINAYVYCAGDPINLTDPTGHMNEQGIIGIITGLIGIGLSIVTFGGSVAASGAIMASISLTLGVTADITGVASIVTAHKDPKASAILGWVSLALGITSIGTGATRLSNTVKETENIRLTAYRTRGLTAKEGINLSEASNDTLIGYHGTSNNNAQKIIDKQNFKNTPYLTDTYENAVHYAATHSDGGAVLGVYLREGASTEKLNFTNPKINTKQILETRMNLMLSRKAKASDNPIIIKRVYEHAPRSSFSIVYDNPLSHRAILAALEPATVRQYNERMAGNMRRNMLQRLFCFK